MKLKNKLGFSLIALTMLSSCVGGTCCGCGSTPVPTPTPSPTPTPGPTPVPSSAAFLAEIKEGVPGGQFNGGWDNLTIESAALGSITYIVRNNGNATALGLSVIDGILPDGWAYGMGTCPIFPFTINLASGSSCAVVIDTNNAGGMQNIPESLFYLAVFYKDQSNLDGLVQTISITTPAYIIRRPLPKRYIFISSAVVPGNIGITKANEACQADALRFAKHAGIYRALLQGNAVAVSGREYYDDYSGALAVVANGTYIESDFKAPVSNVETGNIIKQYFWSGGVTKLLDYNYACPLVEEGKLIVPWGSDSTPLSGVIIGAFNDGTDNNLNYSKDISGSVGWNNAGDPSSYSCNINLQLLCIESD